MEDIGSVTPVKTNPYSDEYGINTPSGGLIFNPFHKEFLNRVGQVTFSPGIFAFNPSPIGRRDSKLTTPSRLNFPFLLSPDVQGDLFPVEIDENPTLQLKLQQELDTQSDDDVQDSIHSFFKNHLIAPSPDTQMNSPLTFGRILPRTSSLLPTATPKGKKKTDFTLTSSSASSFSEVSVQTALSMPPDFDFESLLRNALVVGNCSNSANDVPVDQLDAASDLGSISLTACTVQRSKQNSARLDRDGRNKLQPNAGRPGRSTSRFNGRSLFSDSSLDFVDESHADDDQFSLKSNTVTQDTTIVTTNRLNDEDAPYRQSSNNDDSDVSLVKQTAALQMALPVNWDEQISSDDDDGNILDNLDHYDGGIMMKPVGVNEQIGDNHFYTNKIFSNKRNRVVCCSPDFYSVKDSGHLVDTMCDDNDGRSSLFLHTDVSFHSPNLSPILPKSNTATDSSLPVDQLATMSSHFGFSSNF